MIDSSLPDGTASCGIHNESCCDTESGSKVYQSYFKYHCNTTWLTSVVLTNNANAWYFIIFMSQ